MYLLLAFVWPVVVPLAYLRGRVSARRVSECVLWSEFTDLEQSE